MVGMSRLKRRLLSVSIMVIFFIGADGISVSQASELLLVSDEVQVLPAGQELVALGLNSYYPEKTVSGSAEPGLTPEANLSRGEIAEIPCGMPAIDEISALGKVSWGNIASCCPCDDMGTSHCGGGCTACNR